MDHIFMVMIENVGEMRGAEAAQGKLTCRQTPNGVGQRNISLIKG
jgi:hypothetical protein